MYSYEKAELHCRVMSNKFQTASKLAERLANYNHSSFFPTEKYNRDKEKLMKLLSELEEDAKQL